MVDAQCQAASCRHSCVLTYHINLGGKTYRAWGNQFSALALRRGTSLVVLISFVCSRDLKPAVIYRTTEDSLIRFFTLLRSQPSALMEFPGGRHTI